MAAEKLNAHKPPRGTEHTMAKLNPKDVRAMRAAYQSGNLKLIAKKYQVSLTTAFRVVNRITWKHVE